MVDARVYRWEYGATGPVGITAHSLRDSVEGRDVLIGTHGFNVDQEGGLQSLGGVDALLRASGQADAVFVGVLWPGDWWVPAINYPTEAPDAVKAGRLLAKFCKDWMSRSRSISFVSHSLGARLILSAMERIGRRVRVACLMAAAADSRCLEREYSAAAANCDTVVNLASRRDVVLLAAYPVGTFASFGFDRDSSLFSAALGFAGPKGYVRNNVQPSQIKNSAGYGHGSYLPDDASGIQPPDAKWPRTLNFLLCAFRGEAQSWESLERESDKPRWNWWPL